MQVCTASVWASKHFSWTLILFFQSSQTLYLSHSNVSDLDLIFLLFFCVKNCLPFSHNVILHWRKLCQVKTRSSRGLFVCRLTAAGQWMWSNHGIVIIFNSKFFLPCDCITARRKAHLGWNAKWWMKSGILLIQQKTYNNATKYLRRRQILWNFCARETLFLDHFCVILVIVGNFCLLDCWPMIMFWWESSRNSHTFSFSAGESSANFQLNLLHTAASIYLVGIDHF